MSSIMGFVSSANAGNVEITNKEVRTATLEKEISDNSIPAPKDARYTTHDPIYIDSNSNFTSANGVTSGDGTAGNPYIIENWDINAGSANGIHISHTGVYFIIRNCVIHDGINYYQYGIYFLNVTDGKIENVTSYNNSASIYLSSSSNINITNCAVYNNYWGIKLYSSSNNNTITNCTVYNNSWYGIHLYYSSNNTITNCTFYNNSEEGINLGDSSNNSITNCNVYNNSVGISLTHSSNNNIITNCAVYNNSYGISLTHSSNNNIITNCAVYNNSYGIPLSYSSNNNQISANQIYDNSGYGIILYDSSNNNIISANQIYNNDYSGIWLWYSTNNLIYNNYFNNTANANSSGGSGNRWNITKTPGTNIVNGAYLGGNYWRDYTGTDANGDGLGDTPYTIPGGSGEQDNLPLVKVVDTEKPKISNVNDVPDPQEVYGHVNITCTVTDNEAVNVVKVNITDPNGATTNSTMMKVGSNSYSYNTTYSVLGNYSYYIWADDISGNQNKSATCKFTIRDTTPPIANAGLDREVNEDVEVTLNASLSWDNVGITIWTWNFIYQGVPVYLYGGVAHYTFTQPGYYVITLNVSDSAGNWAVDVLNITVKDITLPVISGIQATPQTQVQGGYVNITCAVTDNAGIAVVKVNITGPAGFTPINTTMTRVGATNNYYYNVLYSISGTYNYYIRAKDTSNNQIESSTYQFTIVSAGPVPISVTVIVNGREVNITGIGTGTINVTSVVLPPTIPENIDSIGIFIEVNLTGALEYANITIKYNESDVAGIDESKLRMYYWDETENKWKICDKTGVDTVNNVVWANVTHLTIFAPMAEKVSVNLAPAAVVLSSPTDITANSMQLSWSQNTDSDFSNYTIYQSTTSGDIGTPIYTIPSQSNVSCRVTGLSSYTTYYFIIRVYDTGGLHNDSNQVSGTTLTEVTTGNLTGIVTDKNGKPIEGVTVTIVATGYVTLTDPNGEYTFTDVTASAYGVTAEKKGYKTKLETGVNINAGETTTLNIVLEKEKKAEEKGFIPGFETFIFIFVLAGCMFLLKHRKKF